MGWNVSSTDWEYCHAGVYEPDTNSYVAVVLSGPDAEAHTRLIAAAPDLLAALEMIDSHLTRCINFSGINPELQERLIAQQDNVRAAIGKAKD